MFFLCVKRQENITLAASANSQPARIRKLAFQFNRKLNSLRLFFLDYCRWLLCCCCLRNEKILARYSKNNDRKIKSNEKIIIKRKETNNDLYLSERASERARIFRAIMKIRSIHKHKIKRYIRHLLSTI